MSTLLAVVAGVLAVPLLVLLAIGADLLLNFTGVRAICDCQWCDWTTTERRLRPAWWVHLRFRIHRDLNHRAAYLDWKANR